jgi:hypothetical protein
MLPTKKRRFQVTRFPARLATGMHGSEPRVSERQAFFRLAPHTAFCSPRGSMLSGSPQPSFLSETGPDARNGLSLAYNGSRFHGSHSRVNVPGLLLRFQRCRSRARSAFRSAAGLVRPYPAASSLQPVACSRPRFAGSPAISTPLRGSYFPPDQSVQLR